MTAVADFLPGVPHVESPLFETIFKQKQVSAQTMDLARQLRTNGYAVFDFPDPDFTRTADTIIKALKDKYDWEAWRNGKLDSLRVQDAWKTLPEVKQIACNPEVLTLLTDLYGREAFPFQTLNFAVGTQQHYHSDSIHFSACPERFMAGVWVALEDIDSDNGPLVYYPGSHALPIFTNEHIGKNPEWGAAKPYTQYPAFEEAWEAIVEAMDLKPLQFHAKKGQALIWAANLLHGGSAQNDLKRTRYSQVTHYYFKGCSYYTPLGSVPFLGKIYHRQITDIRTGQVVPNMVNGVRVRKSANGDGTGLLGKLFTRKPPAPKAAAPVAPVIPLPAGFDGKAYLEANPDVAAAGADPATHWRLYGSKENRPLR